MTGSFESFNRRHTLAMALTVALASPSCLFARGQPRLAFDLAVLEREAGGRLGVALIDGAAGGIHGWRFDERFAHCSSFKLSLAAQVLQGAEKGHWSLSETLHWARDDLLPSSPATTSAIDSELTLEQLARAALITSDNTAANMLLRKVGGPAALTGFWRSIGDRVSRLDRYEPELNRVPKGSLPDTTSPRAMAHTVARLVIGNVLGPEARSKITGWMAEVETGKRRLRAGFPAGWMVGDKTGTGYNPVSTTYVDLAWARPPGRAPLIVTAYFEPAQHLDAVDPESEAVLARVGEICARSVLGA